MCYRIATPSESDIEDEFHIRIEMPEGSYTPYFHTSGFAKPQIPVVTVDNRTKFVMVDWRNPLEEYDTLNAKCEEIFMPKKFFQKFAEKRGIIPVSGFYESMEVTKFNKKTGLPLKAGEKYPYFISLDKPCFGIACLISNFNTISVLTTSATEMMAEIHNLKKRMPVIIYSEDYRRWLSKDLSQKEQADLMQPYEQKLMNARPVSKLIYSRFENPNVPEAFTKHLYEGANLPYWVKGKKFFENSQLQLL